jgi:hypothetical protein
MQSPAAFKSHARRGNWTHVLLLAGLLSFAAPAAQAVESAAARENQIKAAFLFNFAQFVEWPKAAFQQPGDPLVIAILGPDPFGPVMDTFVRGENVQGHPLRVERHLRIADIKTCHILYVNEPDEAKLAEILSQLKGRNILTVSDAGRFAEQGGMIHLVKENNKMRFRVNLAAATEAKLTVSSKLLKAGEIVGAP